MPKPAGTACSQGPGIWGAGARACSSDHCRTGRDQPSPSPWQDQKCSRLSPWAAGGQHRGQMARAAAPCPSLSSLVLPPARGGISTPLTISVVNETRPRLSSGPEPRCALSQNRDGRESEEQPVTERCSCPGLGSCWAETALAHTALAENLFGRTLEALD